MRRIIVLTFAIILTVAMSASSIETEPNNYVKGLTAKIKEHHKLDSSLFASKNLSVNVKVKINEKGGVLTARILSGSGNLAYDSFVLKKLNQAAPFGAPPVALREELKRDGIELIICSKACP